MSKSVCVCVRKRAARERVWDECESNDSGIHTVFSCMMIKMKRLRRYVKEQNNSEQTEPNKTKPNGLHEHLIVGSLLLATVFFFFFFFTL